MKREIIHHLIDELLDLGNSLPARVPSDARAHFLSAKREALLGLRALIDHSLDDSHAPEAEEHSGSRRIPLDQ